MNEKDFNEIVEQAKKDEMFDGENTAIIVRKGTVITVYDQRGATVLDVDFSTLEDFRTTLF